MTVADLALEKIAAKYPLLNTEIAMAQDYGNGFFSFFFGVTDSISVQFKNYDFIFNRPLYTPPSAPSTIDLGNMVLVGGYSRFTDF